MNMTLIEKLVLNKDITNEEVEQELFNICSTNYPNCSEGCPVYKLNRNKIVGKYNYCETFQNGHNMRMFIIFKNREKELTKK
ncbi:MAG TPA: hypothetical protein VMZ91_09850 [Candidatus Paceibacterota bacterium]|nr:hypothetical protein [Candidatus Paceibacterota bacterium]